ncbi:MAG TPA: type IV toxin-antitoxin system AbiEi family antitoxin domain-containing protein [Euzebyales bacterium]|nr:type IV toxin-antitoxin system AbiEi family antitoxin domain-containing protein [Euzebyales bacterium]
MDELNAWLRMRREQHDVATRAQLMAQGFTDGGIRAQVDAGRWQRLHDGVYALFSGPPSAEALSVAALLACRGVALLSHESAGELYGFVASDPDRPIHVTVPYGTSAFRGDGLRVHRSRAFAHIAATGARPPRTTRAHTVLDLAVAASDAQEAMRVTHQLALDGGVHPLALERAVELRRPARHRRAIVEAIRLLRDGVLSALERRYLEDVEQAHGLPAGRRQRPVLVDGVQRWEDLAYEMPAGRVIVRLDGFGYHRDRSSALVDRRRTVAAALVSTLSVPYGWDEVTRLPCRTAKEIDAMLRPLGWDGPFLPCPRCCA